MMVNTQPRIHVKICDSGWIIEKMAKMLADQISCVSYSLEERDSVDLIYHMPYLTYNTTSSNIRRIGYFTHLEQDEPKRSHFFRAAADFHYLVCQSLKTANLFNKDEFDRISVISPGVDLEKFTPELRIGVVGRTYDSGRKGENLVRSVMSLPGISWRFTGRGWPGDSQFLADSEMPSFYRSVDYILVTSLNEGGPMCVLEALACGRPVIAPDVGWVNEFPHIAYDTGDADSLRRVLLKLQTDQMQRRAAVLDRTWRNWVVRHVELFQCLLPNSRIE